MINQRAAVLTAGAILVVAATFLVTRWARAADDVDPRIDALITRLQAESLEETLQNADCVDDWEYPGYRPSGLPEPYDDVLTVLSNRRFAKLYGGLKALSPDERFALLDKYFNKFLQQSAAIVLKFKPSAEPSAWPHTGYSAPAEQEDIWAMHKGTRHALQAVALLSAAFGETRMWPKIESAFENPVYGVPLDESLIHPDAAEQFRTSYPLFTDGMRAEVIFLMAEYSDEAAARQVSFDKQAVLRAVEDRTVVRWEIPDFRSRSTQFDLSHDYIDRTFGVYSINFVFDKNQGVIEKVISAGMNPATQ